MEKISYEPISKLMVTLLNLDKLNTYDFLAAELDASKSTISKVKKGRDVCIRHYIHVIGCVMSIIRLTFLSEVMLRQVRRSLVENRDLVVGTLPHGKNGCKKPVPDDWEVVAKWE